MTGASRDVIVVGGGLVGAATALGVARAGRSVLLVDRVSAQAGGPGGIGRLGVDIRNIACSPASRALLESIDVWPELAATAYRQMRVWEERGTAELVFDAADVGRRELGWILENTPTVRTLWDLLEAEPGFEIVLGEVTGLAQTEDRVSLEVDHLSHEALLLIGVDGARSAVRSLVKAEVEISATGQQALATVVQTERGHQGVAYQRFLLDGPLALLPSRQPNLSSVVWSQSPASAEARVGLSEEAFCAELGEAIENRLGRITAVDERLMFPLQQHVVADFNPAARVLLIGDAARVLHPLAGLGANIGFEDIRDLLARLATLPPGTDPGTQGIWRAFARKRRVRAQLMVLAMAGFRTVYAEGDPLRQWLRNSAVGWVNGLAPLKQQIIREALGLGPLASSW